MIIVLLILFVLFLVLVGLAYFGFWQITIYFGLAIIIFFWIMLLFWLNEIIKVFVKGNAPYVRTSKKMIRQILAEIEFKDNALVYDLGCGDGRFGRELVKQKNVQVIGFEYFIVPYLLGHLINLFSKNKIKIKLKDFFKEDLSKADYIFCYLIDKEQSRLEEKLKKELKPGAIVISNTFEFKNWQPLKIIKIDKAKKTGLSHFVYVYRK